jgi:hypothetical protein
MSSKNRHTDREIEEKREDSRKRETTKEARKYIGGKKR